MRENIYELHQPCVKSEGHCQETKRPTATNVTRRDGVSHTLCALESMQFLCKRNYTLPESSTEARMGSELNIWAIVKKQRDPPRPT